MFHLIKRTLNFPVIIWENFLNHRLERKHRQQIKRNQRKRLLLLLEDLLITILIVMIIQQYFVQLYVIPSRSMENTILVGDRILADNWRYGAQLLPDWGKLPQWNPITRGDVIIFNNPELTSRGTGFKLFRKFVFFITLSFVDLDKDAQGNPLPSLLVKRTIGMPGDILYFQEQDTLIRIPGLFERHTEAKIQALSGLSYELKKETVNQENLLYNYLRRKKNQYTPSSLQDFKLQQELLYQDYTQMLSQRNNPLLFREQVSELGLALYPLKANYLDIYLQTKAGQYIPMDSVLPLGDNRANSRDGRFFGSLNQEQVLGRAWVTLWPLKRLRSLVPSDK